MEQENKLDARKAFEALARIMSNRGDTVIQVVGVRKKQDPEAKQAWQQSEGTNEKEVHK